MNIISFLTLLSKNVVKHRFVYLLQLRKGIGPDYNDNIAVF